MKIALIQINPLVGDIAGNQKKILQWIQKATREGADLACFPEMALIGYPPRDLLELPYLIDKAQEALGPILQASESIAVLFGSVLPNPHSVGKKLHNSALWCQNGQIRAIFHKRLLPTYDVFDETRYFEPGAKSEVLEYKGLKIGVTVCEDLWNDPTVLERRFYAAEPLEDLAGQGAELIINLSASPYARGKLDQRLKLLRRVTNRHRVSVAYVNQVGGNDELIFDGGSMVLDPLGNVTALAPFFKEGMALVDYQPADRREAAPVGPRVQDLSIFPDDLRLLEDALVCGLRDYVKKCGFKKVALGLSGGIDSALVAYLAAKALGPKNVLGLIMPSRFSSEASKKDALALARNLKVPTKIVPIKEIHKAYEKSFKGLFGGRKPDTTEENAQARIRGNLLMAVSNKLGHLVLSTGNKSEIAVGYCTLYGDMSGGLSVISDLPKTLVYDLCRFINRRKPVIPEAIIMKEPTAELRPNQRDQDSLPPYEILDGILKAVVEDLKDEPEIVKLGYDAKTVKKVVGMIRRNEYKRRQAAPGLKVTSKAFGMGRRYPIACKV